MMDINEIAPVFAVLFLLGLNYYLKKLEGIRGIVRQVFSFLVYSAVAINVCDFILQSDPGKLIWLYAITARSLFITAAGILIGYLVMLLTKYTNIKDTSQFIREMKIEPYRIFIAYLAIMIVYMLVQVNVFMGIMDSYEKYENLGVREEYFGVMSDAWLQMVGYTAAFASIVFPIVHILVYIKLFQPNPKVIGNMIVILVGFIGVGLSYYLFTTLFLSIGLEIYGPRSIIDVVLLSIIAFSLKEPKLLLSFDVEPENTLDTATEYNLTPGVSYLIEEEKPDKSFKIFVDQVNHGAKGLCITRTNPDQVRLQYNLTKTNILWLTDITTNREDVVKPLLEDVSIVIHEFIQEGGDLVILLDGLEYLVAKNQDFNAVLQLIDRLKDSVSVAKAKFIIPISPSTIGDQERALLERETTQI